MTEISKKGKDYHDYVIKNGRFIGEFEKMYKDCDNPWPQSIEDLEKNPVSSYVPEILKKQDFRKLFSIGIGDGLHANWLRTKVRGLKVQGCDVSKTAIEHTKLCYPEIEAYCLDVRSVFTREWDFDVILLREVLWYILPEWEFLVSGLIKSYSGKSIILEVTCYDDQRYGKEYFDGPEDIIKKFPFTVKEVLRHHVSSALREGMIMIFGTI